jgi:phospholipid/cholesterol/gamma-HCH transport system substrate-binding protein
MANAGKVGMLIVVFGTLLLGAFAILQKSMFAPAQTTYYADFQDAGGVTSGAKVLLAGVSVGHVESVALSDGMTARLKLRIDDKVKIPVGTEAVLPTSLVGIGDRQIELVPPARKPTSSLAAEAVIPGKMKSPLEAFMPDSAKTVDALTKTLEASTKTLEGINKLVTDQSLKGDVQKLMRASAETAERFGMLAARLDASLQQNQGELNKMVRNGSAMTTDLAAMTKKFNKVVQSGQLEGSLDKVVTSLTTLLDRSQALVSDLRAVINDPAMRANMNEIMANTATMTKSGTQIAENANKLVEKGIEVGENVNQLMIKANKLADEAQDLFKEVKKKIVGGDGGGIAGSLSKIEVSADQFRETNPNRWRSEFGLRIPSGKQSYHVGVWDAFESNKLTLQMGQPLGKSAEARYGVYAGKPGLGLDLMRNQPFGLRADVFDANKPRLDLRARYSINKNANLWFGLERVFDRNAPSFGIGIRR